MENEPMEKECVLYDRKCIDCGECLVCDLDSSKICDNCCACIDDGEDYRSLNILEFLERQEDTERFGKRKK